MIKMFNHRRNQFRNNSRIQNNNFPQSSQTNINLLPPPPSYEDSIRFKHVTSNSSTTFNGNTDLNNLVLPQQIVELQSTTNNPSQSSQLGTVNTEEKYLTNWSVRAERKQLQPGNTVLEIVLSGSLLGDDKVTISIEHYDAGKLEYLKSKNVVKTNTGVYRLIGPITKGYPNNLYRACLHIKGIPRTWKYLLTQFTGMPTNSNQSLARSGEFFNNSRLLFMISKYRLIHKLLLATNIKLKAFGKHYNPSNIAVYQFHQKLIQARKIINNLIIMIIKEGEMNFV